MTLEREAFEQGLVSSLRLDASLEWYGLSGSLSAQIYLLTNLVTCDILQNMIYCISIFGGQITWAVFKTLWRFLYTPNLFNERFRTSSAGASVLTFSSFLPRSFRNGLFITLFFYTSIWTGAGTSHTVSIIIVWRCANLESSSTAAADHHSGFTR